MSVKRYLAPALVCMLMGCILVLQARTHARRVQTQRDLRATDEMVAQLVRVNQHREQLIEEIRYYRGLADEQATQARLQERLFLEQSAAGLQALYGPGVVVTMGRTTPGTSSGEGVDAQDVLRVMNELKAAGAEAISVGGARVTERLQLTRVGRTGPIAINGFPVIGPVVVQAIGDPAVLMASLNLRGGVVQELQYFYPITVSPSARVEVPAVPWPPVYQHATVRD